MAKHTGMTIRIGAAYDTVNVTKDITFDRAEMRMHDRNDYLPSKAGKALVDRLNKEVVNAYCDAHDINTPKDDRRRKFGKKHSRDQRREAKKERAYA